MSRSLVPRKSLIDNSNWLISFEYPFSEIASYPHEMITPLIDQSYDDARALAGDFPNNIDECLWYNAGQDDEDPWILLCRLKTGAYAIYKAGYQCSGFTIVGDMYLTVSLELADIIEYGMSNYQYALYEEETEIV